MEKGGELEIMLDTQQEIETLFNMIRAQREVRLGIHI